MTPAHEALSLVLLWERQARRWAHELRNPPMELLIDKTDQDAIRDHDANQHFAIVSLSNLRKAIDLAHKLTSDEDLAKLRDRFDAEVPTARPVRNLHEHLDAYLRGVGRDAALQAGFDALERSARPHRSMIGTRTGPMQTVVVKISPDVEIELLGALDTASSIGSEAAGIVERHTR